MFDHYDNEPKVTLIDFGLSGKYLNQHLQHIPFKSTEKIVGTPLYASNNALLGKEISRRDDIESMIYILIYCLKGSLPWQGVLKMDFLQSENAKKKILQMRDPDGPLLREIPSELRSLLAYAQSMDFEAEPDYERIETILTLILEKNGLSDSLQLP